MSLSLEERREARRRRILENSEKRLAKILNKEDDTEKETPSATKVIENNHSHQLNESASHQLNESASHQSNESASQVPGAPIKNQECDFSGIERLKELLPSKTEETAERSEHSFVYEKKYFVVMAILVYVILVNDAGHLINDSMILPFLTVSIIKLTIVYRSTKLTSNLFLQLLVLYGINPSLSLKLFKLGKIFHEFFLDFCVYFFTFIMFHVLIDVCTSSGYLKTNGFANLSSDEIILY